MYHFYTPLNETLENYNLEPVVQQSQDLLQEFATRPNFTDQMQLTFGDEVKATPLQETWASGNLGTLPEIEVLPASEINGANGAFAKETNTLYLSQELLNQGNTDTITTVFLEEYGHYLDSQLSQAEALGDEGELFSELARGSEVNELEVAQLKSQDDQAITQIHGHLTEIEQDNAFLVSIPMELDFNGFPPDNLPGEFSFVSPFFGISIGLELVFDAQGADLLFTATEKFGFGLPSASIEGGINVESGISDSSALLGPGSGLSIEVTGGPSAGFGVGKGFEYEGGTNAHDLFGIFGKKGFGESLGQSLKGVKEVGLDVPLGLGVGVSGGAYFTQSETIKLGKLIPLPDGNLVNLPSNRIAEVAEQFSESSILSLGEPGLTELKNFRDASGSDFSSLVNTLSATNSTSSILDVFEVAGFNNFSAALTTITTLPFEEAQNLLGGSGILSSDTLSTEFATSDIDLPGVPDLPINFDLLGDLVNLGESVWNTISSISSDGINLIKGLPRDALESLESLSNLTPEVNINEIITATDELANEFSDDFGNVIDDLKTLSEDANGKLQQAIDSVKQISEIGEFVQNQSVNSLTELLEEPENIPNSIKNFISNTVLEAGSLISSALENVDLEEIEDSFSETSISDIDGEIDVGNFLEQLPGGTDSLRDILPSSNSDLSSIDSEIPDFLQSALDNLNPLSIASQVGESLADNTDFLTPSQEDFLTSPESTFNNLVENLPTLSEEDLPDLPVTGIPEDVFGFEDVKSLLLEGFSNGNGGDDDDQPGDIPAVVTDVSASPTTINETDNNTVTFTIKTENTAPGDTVDLNFPGVIDNQDVQGNLPSTATVEADGTATVDLTFSADQETEGAETFILEAGIEGEPVISDQITVEDTSDFDPGDPGDFPPIVSFISTSQTTVNETDNNTVTFTIETANTGVGDTVDLNFEGDINSQDVEGSLPSTATVEADGTATVELTFSDDQTSEGEENFTLEAAIEGDAASSAQITVNDTSQENTGNENLKVVNTNDSGPGSLRNAIEQANANEGEDTITFDESILEAPFPGIPATASIDLSSGQLEITDDLTIEGLGAGALTIDALGNSRVFSVNNGNENLIDVTLSGLEIVNGETEGNGGGVLNAENLTLINTSVAFNSATATQSPGGGIANINGTLTLVNSTVLENESANSGGGILSSSERDNALNVLNSTISNNDAAFGGAGIQINEGEAQIVQSTIADNSSNDDAGAGGIKNSGNLRLGNSIVDDNQPSDIDNNGSISTFGNDVINLVGDGSLSGENVINKDALLQDFPENNGGPTNTYSLDRDSPAIDTNSEIPGDEFDLDGNGETSDPLPFDQRGEGFDRVVDNQIDLGAVEIQQPVNDPPQVDNAISKQNATEDESFQFQVPENTFSDPDDETLNLSASLADGSELPDWLSFNADNRTFSGTPGEEDDGSLDIQVTAEDSEGATANDSFTLNVEEQDTVTNLNWNLVGTGNFDGSGQQDDLLWRNTSTGENVVWEMDGTTRQNIAQLETVADLNWSLIGASDFNQDHQDDLLWHNSSDGRNLIWEMNGTNRVGSSELDSVTDLNQSAIA